jgi:hypothetical protein
VHINQGQNLVIPVADFIEELLRVLKRFRASQDASKSNSPSKRQGSFQHGRA